MNPLIVIGCIGAYLVTGVCVLAFLERKNRSLDIYLMYLDVAGLWPVFLVIWPVFASMWLVGWLDVPQAKEVNLTPKKDWTGKRGIAITDLRPAGKVQLEGETFDARAEDGYIAQESKVVVARADSFGLVVRLTRDAGAPDVR